MSWEDDILEAVMEKIMPDTVRLPGGDIARVIGWSHNITLDDGPFTREWVEENVPTELVDAGQVYHVLRPRPDAEREFFHRDDVTPVSVDVQRAVELTIAAMLRHDELRVLEGEEAEGYGW